MNKQIKQIAVGLMVFGLVLSVTSQLTGCAKTVATDPNQGPQGVPGPAGSPGPSGSSGEAATNPGLFCTAYSILPQDYASTVNWDQMFNDGTEKFTTVFANFNVPNEPDTLLFTGFTQTQQDLLGPTNWALDCEGFLNVPETGEYTFQLSSDDGSELAINDQVVINMPNSQAYATTTNTVSLFAGPQKINVLYFQSLPVNFGLTLAWQGPESAGMEVMTVVPASAFTYQTQ